MVMPGVLVVRSAETADAVAAAVVLELDDESRTLTGFDGAVAVTGVLGWPIVTEPQKRRAACARRLQGGHRHDDAGARIAIDAGGLDVDRASPISSVRICAGVSAGFADLSSAAIAAACGAAAEVPKNGLGNRRRP